MDQVLIEKRFWGFVEKADGCWLWRGERTTTGYGQFRYGHAGRMKAHRFSFLIANGFVPEVFVLHKCDNPLCVNPDHLYEGVAKDNSQDMVSRLRHANQKKAQYPKGHSLALENVYIHRNGSRRCKQCAAAYAKKKTSNRRPIKWQK